MKYSKRQLNAISKSYARNKELQQKKILKENNLESEFITYVKSKKNAEYNISLYRTLFLKKKGLWK